MDAVTGRFVSVDPLAVAPPELMLSNPQFIHAYSYAGNNPIAYRDPDGEFLATTIGAAVGGVGGAITHAIKYKISGKYRDKQQERYGDSRTFLKGLAESAGKGLLAGAATGLVIDTAGVAAAAAGAGAVIATNAGAGATGGLVSGVLGEVISSKIDSETFKRDGNGKMGSAKRIAKSAAYGALFGAAGLGLSELAGVTDSTVAATFGSGSLGASSEVGLTQGFKHGIRKLRNKYAASKLRRDANTFRELGKKLRKAGKLPPKNRK